MVCIWFKNRYAERHRNFLLPCPRGRQLLGRVHTSAFCCIVTAIRRSGRCYIVPVLFAARTDPPCCPFSSAHQRRKFVRVSVLAASWQSLASTAGERTAGGSQRAAISPDCAQSCPTRASRTPRGYVAAQRSRLNATCGILWELRCSGQR